FARRRLKRICQKWQTETVAHPLPPRIALFCCLSLPPVDPRKPVDHRKMERPEGIAALPASKERISKSNGHGEREQYDRKSLQHSDFLPRYPLTDALVRLTHQRHGISSRHFTGLASPGP